MEFLFERPEAGRRAVLLCVTLTGDRDADAADPDEFVELAESAELSVAAKLTATRAKPHPRWFVGAGKLDEIRAVLAATGAEVLLVDHELGAGQQRTLERDLGVRVFTRTEVILAIFADRARTHEGQLQVELAQLRHAQTRLVRGWTHLDRQKGGIGLRGAGEKQIELDQRMLGERIRTTVTRLEHVQRRRAVGRRGRARRGTPTVALVGYTNAGKSTLFNRLTRADVLAEDKLFATLDPTMRELVVPGCGRVVLADTVGFVSRLPHTLVDAFKATLEEVSSADLLLHVIDASDPRAEERITQVRAVLREIDAHEVPALTVWNKMDAVTQDAPLPHDALCVSAATGAGCDRLVRAIGDAMGVHAPHEIVIDAGDGKLRASLYAAAAVLDERVLEDGNLALTVRADARLMERLRRNPRVFLRAAALPARAGALLRGQGPLPRISSLPN